MVTVVLMICFWLPTRDVVRYASYNDLVLAGTPSKVSPAIIVTLADVEQDKIAQGEVRVDPGPVPIVFESEATPLRLTVKAASPPTRELGGNPGGRFCTEKL